MAEKPAAKAATFGAADVFAGFVDSLVSNQTIGTDEGARIKAAIAHRRGELEGAVAALKTKAKE